MYYTTDRPCSAIVSAGLPRILPPPQSLRRTLYRILLEADHYGQETLRQWCDSIGVPTLAYFDYNFLFGGRSTLHSFSLFYVDTAPLQVVLVIFFPYCGS